MDAAFISRVLEQTMGGLFIPEYTHGDLRIDAAVIYVSERNVRGFEIKVSREDFLRDKKWQMYSTFCSSVSIACPKGMIKKDEVSSPFGLVWVDENGTYEYEKTPKNIQSRESLAWTFTYLSVLEKEIARLVPENNGLRLTQRVRDSAKV